MSRQVEYAWTHGENPHTFNYLLDTIEKEVDRFIKIKNIHGRNVRIFDAGCGNGSLGRWLNNRGYEVAGCDISDKGVEFARKLCPEGIFRKMSVYDNMAETFGGDWDIVISLEVIEHLYSPREFLAQVKKLLTSDGLLIISTPYHGYLKNLALAISGKLDNHFTALWDGGHIKFWSRRTLTELLYEQNYDVVAFHGVGRMPWLWKSMIVAARNR